MLLLNRSSSAGEEGRAEQLRFAGKFQQVTAPVMAKGLEDTAFYKYTRLLSLNEVGNDAGRFGVPPQEFASVFSGAPVKMAMGPFRAIAVGTFPVETLNELKTDGQN